MELLSAYKNINVRKYHTWKTLNEFGPEPIAGARQKFNRLSQGNAKNCSPSQKKYFVLNIQKF